MTGLEMSAGMRWTPLVLLVHAREHERVLYGNELRRLHFSVLEAADSREALWIARDFLPDAITLDLLAPRVNGLRMAARLKAAHVTANIRTIAVTSVSFGAVLTHARAVGFDRVLTKPCPPERLAAEVMDLLGWPGGYRHRRGAWHSGVQR